MLFILIVILDSIAILGCSAGILTAVVGIRVVILMRYTLFFGNLISIKHPATTTALVHVVTINKVLN